MLESDLVFNLVWTGGVYEHLRYFVFSLLDQTECRYRYIANNCTPRSIEQMRAFAAAAPDRVVEVFVTGEERMVPHGTALDPILAGRDDGDLFCFIDVDIKATGPFVGEFLALMDGVDVVTSGREIWTDSNVLPESDVGVGGRHFYSHDGFTFGSPHFAIYHREILQESLDRWGIAMNCGSEREMPPATWDRVKELGRDYLAYDTAKVINILLQGDGAKLVHREHEALVHVGGLSHYLAPPEFDFANVATDGEFDGEASWVKFKNVELRASVARFTAEMLANLVVDRPPAPIPEGLDDDTQAKLELVKREVTTMVADARPWLELTGE